MPSSVSSLNEEISGPRSDGVKAMNSFYTRSHRGPCPRSRSHCHVFAAHASDVPLSISDETTFPRFQDAAKDHILDEAIKKLGAQQANIIRMSSTAQHRADIFRKSFIFRVWRDKKFLGF